MKCSSWLPFENILSATILISRHFDNILLAPKQLLDETCLPLKQRLPLPSSNSCGLLTSHFLVYSRWEMKKIQLEQNIILGRTVAEVLSNFSYHIDIVLLTFLYVEVTPSVLYQIILRN